MTVQYAKDQSSDFVNKIRSVAIVGAGGSVGKHVAQELLKTGKHTVTALTRADSQNQLPEGVLPAKINYADEDSLVTALQGRDILIITLAVSAPPDIQSKLIQAAAKAGVRFIIPNTWGCDFMNDGLANSGVNWDRFRATFDEIEATGVCSWIAMVSGFWYEHSLVLGPAGFGFDIPAKRLTYFDDGNTKTNISTQPQTGRAVAALLSLNVLPQDENDRELTLSRWRNKPVYISSFLISQKDMFESWKRVTGDRDEDWTISYESSEERYHKGLEEMKKGERMGFVQAMYSRVFFPNGDGNFEAKYGLANSLLGLPSEDLDEHTRNAKAMVDRGYNYMSNRN